MFDSIFRFGIPCAAVLFCAALFSFSCRRNEKAPVLPENVQPAAQHFSSYLDIPGVTQAEIDAIENLKIRTPLFTYGMTMSTECFRTESNITSGFSALYCQWLSDLFGIKFRPVVYEWDKLLAGLASHDISFSGEIPASLEGDGSYFMTDPIAERRIKIVSTEGADRLEILARSRSLNYGFLAGTNTEALVSPYISQAYKSVQVSNYNEAYLKLVLKEIDMLFMDETVEGIFSLYGNLMIQDFQPITYNMVSMATADPELEPVISVVRKYMQSAGSYLIAQMYNTGYRDYQRYVLNSRLTLEERRYIRQHQEAGQSISVAIEADDYPMSFYNQKENAWQGIAVDLLEEIEDLSGLRFVFANSPNATLQEVMDMPANGKAQMMMGMVRTLAGKKGYLATDSYYLTDNYAFISLSHAQDISLADVPYRKVGLVTGSASAEMFAELFPNHRNTVHYRDRHSSIQALGRGEIELLMGTRNLLLLITNYMEQTGYKANLVLRRPYECSFSFAAGESTLASIVGKAQNLMDTRAVVDNWTRRVFDYSGALARAQLPYLVGVSILLAVILALLTLVLIRHRQMNVQLEKTVQQRTHELELRSAELEVQTQAAKVASQAKGEFLARMSHEIRTPLNAIIGMTEIAHRAETIEKKDQSLNEITIASRHLLGILNDVLDMAKIESGKFEIIQSVFGIQAAMQEVAAIIIRRCDEKYINFETEFESLGNTGVLGDKLRLKQILINLLGNAVKFTPEQGTIRFLVQKTGETENSMDIHFSVIDTGIGINEDQIKNLFNAFEQADSSISARFGGTGLGLAISQNLVRQMGGLITVSSVPGQGSCFEFTLHMDTAENPDVENEGPENDELVFPGKRLLLAEDIDINRLILKELLTETKIEIDEAADGAKALEIFNASPPNYYDLIFMDVQMPNMDGHEATMRIRELDRPDAKTIPILAMTASAYKEDIDRALAAGMNAHLAKPININDVKAALKQWIGN
ncbi:MAG: transporter substrate-binding domain-containing protein [Treponema sp.]|jgi:signal transduction histidine kinase/CheY-like chemotaxis protein|nr:transporter substrate-binding domain-containing protein [Treponema sp.]